MTTNSDLANVIALATLTEHRAPDEQRSMLAVALRLDCELGAFVLLNRELQAPRYVAFVRSTYTHCDCTSDPCRCRHVDLNAEQVRRYDQLTRRWALCDRCHLPNGAHYADDRCPDNPLDIERVRAGLDR